MSGGNVQSGQFKGPEIDISLTLIPEVLGAFVPLQIQRAGKHFFCFF
jgi:hypothetical protein